MAREYNECDRIKSIAERLIEAHHQHLKNARIAYVMKETDEESEAKPPKPPREGKARKIAKARLVPQIYSLLSGYDFIIEADELYWDPLAIEQQEAVVDHELCHCMRDEKGWYVRDHDVQEFKAILERHGFWHETLEEFVTAAPAQQALPFRKVAGAQR